MGGDVRGVVGVKSSVARCVGRSRRTPQRSTLDDADPVPLRRRDIGYRAVVFRLVTGLERWCPIDGGDPIVGHLHGMPHPLLMRKRVGFPPLPVLQRRTPQTSHRGAWVASVVVDRVTYVRMLCCGTDPCPTGLTTMSRAFWGRNRQFGYACIVVAQAAYIFA